MTPAPTRKIIVQGYKSETVHFDLHVLLLNTGLLYASYYVINLVLFS